MELEHSFTVPVPIDEAWPVLLDVERIALCMPGASFESFDGGEFTGQVKVKLGPIRVTYGGTARLVNRDDVAHTVIIEASGQETRGSGSASATIRMSCHEQPGETEVKLVVDLAVTGKPAQFGRSVMADVSAKLVDQFARSLADELAGIGPPTDSVQATGQTPEAVPVSGSVDLLNAAWKPVLKRAAPVMGILLSIWLLVRYLRGGLARYAGPATHRGPE